MHEHPAAHSELETNPIQPETATGVPELVGFINQGLITGITDCDIRGGQYLGAGSSCDGAACGGSQPAPPSADPACPNITIEITDSCTLYQGVGQPVLIWLQYAVSNVGTQAVSGISVKAGGTTMIQPSNVVPNTGYHSFGILSVGTLQAGETRTLTQVISTADSMPSEPLGPTTVLSMIEIEPYPTCTTYVSQSAQVTIGPTNVCPPERFEDRTPDPEGGTGTEPAPEPSPEPEPDPQPTLLPNLWVTGMTGCWAWSNDGQEHVIATVTGIVHNGGQADAANVRARVTAGGKSTTVTVGTIPAGGQKTVSATLDVGDYDQVSWPISTSIDADPFHAIPEADESNNSTSSAFPQSNDCN